MNFQYQDRSFQITRYPKTNNRSLRAWSAADEHILQFLESENFKDSSTAIYNDRFGFLTCLLHQQNPFIIINHKSQEKSCMRNLEANEIDFSLFHLKTPLENFSEVINLGIIKAPKSLDLFKFYLYQLSNAMTESGTVVVAFMTRHFSKQLLTIANEFFEEMEQSRAWKKSRLLILKKKKPSEERSFLHEILFEGEKFQQYAGVFSKKNIDYASQFFLEHLNVKETEKRVLDLASGNGVLAHFLQKKNADLEIHLMDDSYLAIESSKLNLTISEKIFFHFNNSMDSFEESFFDLVVSNPPFHFEYENNIEIAIDLFVGVERCLKQGGRFQLVASKHLNFKSHLIRLFPFVGIVEENKQFIIYECFKKK